MLVNNPVIPYIKYLTCKGIEIHNGRLTITQSKDFFFFLCFIEFIISIMQLKLSKTIKPKPAMICIGSFPNNGLEINRMIKRK